MSTLKRHYWVCYTESKIYHSKPKFEGEFLKIDNHVITSLERYRKVALKDVLPLLSEWRENYVFQVYALPKYEIIDCPELEEIQKSYNLDKLYIPYRSTGGKGASLRLSQKNTKPTKDIWGEIREEESELSEIISDCDSIIISDSYSPFEFFDADYNFLD